MYISYLRGINKMYNNLKYKDMKKVKCYELNVYSVVEGSRFLVSSVSYFNVRKARSSFLVGCAFFDDKPYYRCWNGFATSVELVLNKVTIDEEYFIVEKHIRTF